jgi:hypothetical protein
MEQKHKHSETHKRSHDEETFVTENDVRRIVQPMLDNLSNQVTVAVAAQIREQSANILEQNAGVIRQTVSELMSEIRTTDENARRAAEEAAKNAPGFFSRSWTSIKNNKWKSITTVVVLLAGGAGAYAYSNGDDNQSK